MLPWLFRRLYTFLAPLVLITVLLCGCVPIRPEEPAAAEGEAEEQSLQSVGLDASLCENRKGQDCTLVVFAAASLVDIFSEVGARFEQQVPGAQVTFNYAGSNLLAEQILQGAPADVFASANPAQMQPLIQVGLLDKNDMRTFAGNKLVVITPANNPAGLKQLQDLAKPGVRLLVADRAVPAGQYAFEFLELSAGVTEFGPQYKDAVMNNIVSYEQSVRAVLNKILLGEADAGIVYTSDVARLLPSQVGEIEIPDPLNPVVQYVIAPMKTADQSNLARAFTGFLSSDAILQLLVDYGFSLER